VIWSLVQTGVSPIATAILVEAIVVVMRTEASMEASMEVSTEASMEVSMEASL